MSDLYDRLKAAKSQLNNLRYARNSTGKPDAIYTLEEMDSQIAEQESVVSQLRAQTFE